MHASSSRHLMHAAPSRHQHACSLLKAPACMQRPQGCRLPALPRQAPPALLPPVAQLPSTFDPLPRTHTHAHTNANTHAHTHCATQRASTHLAGLPSPPAPAALCCSAASARAMRLAMLLCSMSSSARSSTGGEQKPAGSILALCEAAAVEGRRQ